MEHQETDPTTGAAPMLQGPKRQHYVPKFYLEGFTKEGLLAVYDRKNDTAGLQQPLNTGVIGHFYTVKDAQGRKRFEVEAMLSEVEAKAAPVIARLAAGGEITDEQRSDFSVFLALAAVRQ